MKKYFLIPLLALSFGCYQDKDDNIPSKTDFCNRSRILEIVLEDEKGELIYLEEKAKFAIRQYPVEPTIDEVEYYILCEKPVNIEEKDSVLFSGKTYTFNPDEGFVPAVGGTKYYFLKPTGIVPY